MLKKQLVPFFTLWKHFPRHERISPNLQACVVADWKKKKKTFFYGALVTCCVSPADYLRVIYQLLWYFWHGTFISFPVKDGVPIELSCCPQFFFFLVPYCSAWICSLLSMQTLNCHCFFCIFYKNITIYAIQSLTIVIYGSNCTCPFPPVLFSPLTLNQSKLDTGNHCMFRLVNRSTWYYSPCLKTCE